MEEYYPIWNFKENKGKPRYEWESALKGI